MAAGLSSRGLRGSGGDRGERAAGGAVRGGWWPCAARDAVWSLALRARI